MTVQLVPSGIPVTDLGPRSAGAVNVNDVGDGVTLWLHAMSTVNCVPDATVPTTLFETERLPLQAPLLVPGTTEVVLPPVPAAATSAPEVRDQTTLTQAGPGPGPV